MSYIILFYIILSCKTRLNSADVWLLQGGEGGRRQEHRRQDTYHKASTGDMGCVIIIMSIHIIIIVIFIIIIILKLFLFFEDTPTID